MALAMVCFLLVLHNTGYSTAHSSGTARNEEVPSQKTIQTRTQSPEPHLKTPPEHASTQIPYPGRPTSLIDIGANNILEQEKLVEHRPGAIRQHTVPARHLHSGAETHRGVTEAERTSQYPVFKSTPVQKYTTATGHPNYNTTPDHQNYNTTKAHHSYNPNPDHRNLTIETSPDQQSHNTTHVRHNHNTTSDQINYNVSSERPTFNKPHQTIVQSLSGNTPSRPVGIDTVPDQTALMTAIDPPETDAPGSENNDTYDLGSNASHNTPLLVQGGSTTSYPFTSTNKENFTPGYVQARITQGPRDQTVCHGCAAMFECQAEGEPFPEMVWFVNRVPVMFDRGRFSVKYFADGVTLKISDVHLENGDRLRVQCMADNGLGPTDESSASVIVSQKGIPGGFPVQTQEEMVHKMIKALDTAEIICGVRGEEPLSIRWYKDMVPLDPLLPKYSFLQDTLLISNTSRIDNGAYSCTAENRHGSVTTNGTALFVGDPAVITRVPRDHKVLNGTRMIFHCQSEGSPPPKLYWKVRGVRVSRHAHSPYNVQKTDYASTLVIGRADYARDHRTPFECVAKNDLGSDSATAILEIYRDYEVPECFPKITWHPKLKAVWLGRSTSMGCSAKGSPTPGVTWLKNEALIDVSRAGYTVTAIGALMIADVQKQDEGTYVCVADNSIGTAYSQPAYLYIRDAESAPKIISTSGDPRVPLGGTADLTCVAVGNPLPYVTWSTGATRLTDQFNIPIGVATIEISNVTTSGEYVCTAYSRLGRISRVVTVVPY